MFLPMSQIRVLSARGAPHGVMSTKLGAAGVSPPRSVETRKTRFSAVEPGSTQIDTSSTSQPIDAIATAANDSSVRKHLHAMSSAPEGGIAAGGVSAPNALTDDCCLSFHVPAPPWLTGPRPGSPVVWVSEHVSHPVGESTHGVGVGSVHAVLNDVCQFVRKPCYIAPVLRIERSG